MRLSFLQSIWFRALFYFTAIGALILCNLGKLSDPAWLPVHDSLFQFTKFLYVRASFNTGEFPLWNSYLYTGQPWFVTHANALALDPLMWVWLAVANLLGISAKNTFVWLSLSQVAVFALGTSLFVSRFLTSQWAGLFAFTFLLFSGDALFWSNQIYSLAMVVYLPWVSWAFLEVAETSSGGSWLRLAVFTGILLNQYYASYFITLAFWFVPAILAFRPRRAIQAIRTAPYGWAAVSVLIIFLLSLPTLIGYLNVKANFFLTNRAQAGSYTEFVKTSAATISGGDLSSLFPSSLQLTRNRYYETIPYAGILSVPFIAVGLYVSIFRFPYLAVLFGLLLLNYLRWPDAFLDWSFRHIPFYSIIRSYGFFSGYLTFFAGLFVAIGAAELTARKKPVFECAKWFFYLGTAALLFWYYPRMTRDHLAGFVALGLFLFGASRLCDRFCWPALYAIFLFAGASNLAYFNSFNYQNQSVPGFFSYSPEFGFDFKRPLAYEEHFPPKMDNLPYQNLYCCVTGYNLAERRDGPYGFDPSSIHQTNLVTNQYIQILNTGGGAEVLNEKLAWFSSFEEVDFQSLTSLERFRRERILPVSRDEAGSLPGKLRASGTAVSSQDMQSRLLHKTANSAEFEIRAPADGLLLYTDQMYDGFTAEVDGKSVPLVSAWLAYKAVSVSEGTHRVAFYFRPLYRYVMLIYLAIACGFPGILIFCRIRYFRELFSKT